MDYSALVIKMKPYIKTVIIHYFRKILSEDELDSLADIFSRKIVNKNTAESQERKENKLERI